MATSKGKTSLQTPMTQEQLLRLDNHYPKDDSRPFGKVTASARAFWIEGDDQPGISKSRLAAGAFEIASRGKLHFGLPVREIVRGERGAMRPKTRKTAATGKDVGSFVPARFPIAYHPKLVRAPSSQQNGGWFTDMERIRRQGSTSSTLTEEGGGHSLIIGKDDREFIWPDAYPHSTVCKLIIETREKPGDDWATLSHATGFLAGKRTLVSSGHAHPKRNAPDTWRIKVIPACWGGRSVFGMEYITYVRSFHWWNYDAGSDIMVCELYDPIGEDLGYLGAVNYDSDWEDMEVWEMCGFPYDRSLWAMTRQRGIAVRDDDDGANIKVNGKTYDTTQVENDADEASGASGAPLFAWFNGDVRAIGVHHGYEIDFTFGGIETLSCAAGGVGFVEAIRWARNSWG